METQKTSPWLIAFRILFTAALIGSIVFIFRNSLQVAAVSSDRSYQVMKIVNSVLAKVNLGPLSSALAPCLNISSASWRISVSLCSRASGLCSACGCTPGILCAI